MALSKKIHSEGVGVVHQLFNTVEVYRLLNILPTYGVLVDVYSPKNSKGSLRGLNTTDISYEETPTHIDLKVVITNLEHYTDNGNMYESFEEDGFLLKALEVEAHQLPRGAKILVKGGVESEEHLTFMVVKSLKSGTPLNNKIAWKCELTPMYLMTENQENLLNIKENLEDLEERGEILPDFVRKREGSDKILKEVRTEEDAEDMIFLKSEGGLYHDN